MSYLLHVYALIYVFPSRLVLLLIFSSQRNFFASSCDLIFRACHQLEHWSAVTRRPLDQEFIYYGSMNLSTSNTSEDMLFWPFWVEYNRI